MEFRISYPTNAIDVENLIRTHCQHFGYPEAKIYVDTTTGELVLKLHDPDPLPNATEVFKTRPTC